jgi:molecular chaperone IbpA
MRSIDFAPLYRSTVGFDRLFGMLDSLAQPDNAQSYPPYNIERTAENAYRISMAVAGFDESEIVIEAKRNHLTVTGKKAEGEAANENAYLYRGIASRGFERRFHLADHVEVTGAALKNGLLHIELKREIPEELKARRIEIATPKTVKAKVIEAKTEAAIAA